MCKTTPHFWSNNFRQMCCLIHGKIRYFFIFIWVNSTWHVFWWNLLFTSFLIIFSNSKVNDHVMKSFSHWFLICPLCKFLSTLESFWKSFDWSIFAIGKSALHILSFFSPIMKKSQVKKAVKKIWRLGMRQQTEQKLNKGKKAWEDIRVK